MKYSRAWAILLYLCFMTVDLDAESLYIWTDKAGVEHITTEPPPKDVKTSAIIEYAPASEKQIEQYEQQKKASLEAWRIGRKRQEALEARRRADEAQKEALEARARAEHAAQAAKEYIETHNQNQYMRLVHKYEMRKVAAEASTARQQALEAEKRAKEAVERARLAEEQLQQVSKGAQNTEP